MKITKHGNSFNKKEEHYSSDHKPQRHDLLAAVTGIIFQIVDLIASDHFIKKQVPVSKKNCCSCKQKLRSK